MRTQLRFNAGYTEYVAVHTAYTPRYESVIQH